VAVTTTALVVAMYPSAARQPYAATANVTANITAPRLQRQFPCDPAGVSSSFTVARQPTPAACDAFDLTPSSDSVASDSVPVSSMNATGSNNTPRTTNQSLCDQVPVACSFVSAVTRRFDAAVVRATVVPSKSIVCDFTPAYPTNCFNPANVPITEHRANGLINALLSVVVAALVLIVFWMIEPTILDDLILSALVRLAPNLFAQHADARRASSVSAASVNATVPSARDEARRTRPRPPEYEWYVMQARRAVRSARSPRLPGLDLADMPSSLVATAQAFNFTPRPKHQFFCDQVVGFEVPPRLPTQPRSHAADVAPSQVPAHAAKPTLTSEPTASAVE
jgi:hypothetical protein